MHLGSEPPWATKLVDQLMADLHDGSGKLVYRISSSFIHGRPHALNRLSVRSTKRESQEVALAQLGVRLDRFSMFGAAPVFGLNALALRALTYAGRPHSVWLDVVGPLLHTWGDSLREAVVSAVRADPPTR